MTRPEFPRLIKGAASLALIAAAAPAAAQTVEREQRQDWSGDPQNVLVLSNWKYDAIYTDAWSVENLLQKTAVYDVDREAIGSVRNVTFFDDGQVDSFIVEVGGVFGLGDTILSVPWTQVTLSDDAMSLRTPITEATLDDFSVFDSPLFDDDASIESFDPENVADIQPVGDEVRTGERVFKATDLIDDFVSLTDAERYGYVRDIVVLDGRIAALVIKAAGSEGDFAYPYAGYNSWVSPTTDNRFHLPYSSEEADVIETFDYDRLRRRSAD
jgi:sporulation protein YlmC with PRC-barrel domain